MSCAFRLSASLPGQLARPHERQTITRAREQGSSWTQIGDALGVTKQAAWALYNQDVRDALDTVRQRSELTDEQAQRLADEERDALRPR